MKKVIFCLLIPVMIQSCTDELHEIDSVVLADDFVLRKDIDISSKDVPHNSFTAFYYFVENNKASVDNKIENKIDHNIDKSDLGKKDFAAYWEGYFDFDSGDYEFTINSDKEIKVSIDGVMIFEGSSNTNAGSIKVGRSLEGIRRLKVFYNMNSDQKLQKIIEYYKSMRESEDDDESEAPISTSANAVGSNDQNQSITSDILVDWQRL